MPFESHILALARPALCARFYAACKQQIAPASLSRPALQDNVSDQVPLLRKSDLPLQHSLTQSQIPLPFPAHGHGWGPPL